MTITSVDNLGSLIDQQEPKNVDDNSETLVYPESELNLASHPNNGAVYCDVHTTVVLVWHGTTSACINDTSKRRTPQNTPAT